MTTQSIPLPTQTNHLASTPGSPERLVNMYAEKLPASARANYIIRSTPGLTAAYSVGAGPIYSMDGSHPGLTYLVSGSHFYRMQAGTGYAPEDLGDIGAGIIITPGQLPRFPTIAVGINEVVVCAPPNAYMIQHGSATGSTVTQIDFSAGPYTAGVSSVTYLDGYYVYTSLDGEMTFCSNLLDPTTFDPLKFQKLDESGQTIAFGTAHLGDLWFFGYAYTGVWYDAGTANFPFAPRQSVVIPYGCASQETIVDLDGSLFWVTAEGYVVQATGYQATRISTSAIEEYLRGADSWANYQAFGYSDNGHSYYLLSLTSTNDGAGFPITTFVYDIKEGLWHERMSGQNGNLAYAGMSACLQSDQALIGSRVDGSLFRCSYFGAQEDGISVPRSMTLPLIQAQTERAFMYRFTLDLEPGASVLGPGNYTLEISDDGGFGYRTVSGARYGTQSVQGDRAVRCYWTRLGSFRQRVMRLTISDRCAIYAAWAEMDVGTDP